ncbi:MAG: hypothetical protein IIZ73_06075 [Ruminococcus sp.]|nr:hypothetical protein [Ruminococcus sp.]
MTKYFLEYLEWLDGQLASEDTDLRRLMEIHREKTRCFQHERLVHLLVMILFALCTVATFLIIVVTERVILIPLALLLLGLLIPYIAHYYFLENNTQKLYRYYDRIAEKLEGDDLYR